MALMDDNTQFETIHARTSRVCIHGVRYKESKKSKGEDKTTKVITLFGSQMSLSPPAECSEHYHEHWSVASAENSDRGGGFSSYQDNLRMKETEITNNSIIKVGMDGTPFMRKLHIKVITGYHNLVIHLYKLFGLQKLELEGLLRIMGGEHGHLTKKELQDVPCILAYMDHEGDWMLVGDIPWELFVQSVQRIHISRAKISFS
ncbi:hypothetical protein KP509_09G065300 [Ceratopteris richardii]|uniref:Auxin-responsive protein n=1 Tax=Ceratopteris richardii TaxID=49495 RepID=A0A8T2U5G6_CERRI|nr:hypothetical protein KP509_09G065300 [Ceratopteris richardii]KAH7429770.1 hypothetical protein KP509_09G065300 [Ceratopteris richardii]